MPDFATLDRMTVGEKLKAMRDAAGLTQKQLGKLYGDRPQRWVSGREGDKTQTTVVEAMRLGEITGHRVELVVVPVADSDLLESLGDLDPEGTRTALRLAQLWPELDDLLRRILLNAIEQIEHEQKSKAPKRA